MNYTQEQLNITESILHIQNQSIDSSKKKKTQHTPMVPIQNKVNVSLGITCRLKCWKKNLHHYLLNTF